MASGSSLSAFGSFTTSSKTYEHLYKSGYINGRYSDVTVHCFGKPYRLHKLLLDQSRFFASTLLEPESETVTKEITLHPEEIDSNITITPFELALRRLYGGIDYYNEKSHAIGLFTTGCWLGMDDLIADSLTRVIDQIAPSNIINCIKLATNTRYEKHAKRILVAVESMLYQDGCEMLIADIKLHGGRLAMSLPGGPIAEMLSSDAFFAPREWYRWLAAKSVFNAKVMAKAISLGLVDGQGKIIHPRPRLSPSAFRVDLEHVEAVDAKLPPCRWREVYTDPDIAPFFDVLDDGIYYTHMTFEQLNSIKNELDCFKIVTMVREDIITGALWQSMSLRQKITASENCNKTSIGLAEQAEDETATSPLPSLDTEGQSKSDESVTEEEDTDKAACIKPPSSGIWRGQPIRYWIPSINSSHLLDDMIGVYRHWRPIFNGQAPNHLALARTGPSQTPSSEGSDSIATAASTLKQPKFLYSKFPPFRFSVEFPNRKSIRYGEQVQSSAVWYAGSFWTVSASKEETSDGNRLSIYISRVDPTDIDDSAREVAYANYVGDVGLDLSLTGIAPGKGGNHANHKAQQTSMLPPYIDSRSTIQVYDKTYISTQDKQPPKLFATVRENGSIRLLEGIPKLHDFRQKSGLTSDKTVPEGSFGNANSTTNSGSSNTARTSLFGFASTTSTFGGGNATSSGLSGNKITTPAPFFATSTAATPGTGNPTTTNLFSSANGSSTFGGGNIGTASSSGSTNGITSTYTTGLFGKPVPASTGTSGSGASTAASSNGKSPTPSLFSNASSAATSSNGKPPTPSIFGTAVSSDAKPATPRLFGDASNAATSSDGRPPTTSLFGNASSTAKSSDGKPPTPSLFGTAVFSDTKPAILFSSGNTATTTALGEAKLKITVVLGIV